MRYLAIDLGLKRIGLAYCAYKDIITPLIAIQRRNRNQAASEIKSVIKEYKIDAIVIGLAIGGSSEDEMRRRVKHFLSLLEFDGDIFIQDESDSSIEAKEIMKGDIRYKKDGRIDSISAMIILKRQLKII